MGRFAGPRTGATGYRTFAGMDIHNISYDCRTPTLVRDWVPYNPNAAKKGILGLLLGKADYDLLASYLVNEIGVLPNALVIYGKTYRHGEEKNIAMARFIIYGNKHYRAEGRMIYCNNFGRDTVLTTNAKGEVCKDQN